MVELISGSPRRDNPSAADGLPNHRASESGSYPDGLRTESPSSRTPRVHANSPPARWEPSTPRRDPVPESALSLAAAPVDPAKAGDNSVRNVVPGETYRRR